MRKRITKKAVEAREKALAVLAEIGSGSDPTARRLAEKHAPTVRELAERYLNEHARPHKKASAYRSIRRIGT